LPRPSDMRGADGSDWPVTGRPAGLAEQGFVIVFLLYFAGALVPSAHVEGHPSPTYDKVMILCQAIFFPLFLLIAYRSWRQIAPGLIIARWLVLLCALAILSTLWSFGHLYTLRRAIIFSISTLFGVYLGSRFSLEAQIRVFAAALGIAIVASLILGAAFPKLGVSQSVHSGEWKGMFMHKNTLGMTMTFSLLLFVFARPNILLTARVFAVAGATILLYESKSQTALLLAAVVPATYCICHLLRIRKRNTLPLWVAFVPALLVGAVGAAAGVGPIFDALGRDSTLSGRTDLWKTALETIAAHPAREWVGYGYSIFWSEKNPDMTAIFAQVGWFPGHGHNGYIDLYLDLGFCGLAIFLAGLLYAIRNTLRLFFLAETAAEKWALPCLIFIVFCNMTESQLIRTHMFLWIPYVALYVSSALKVYDREQAVVQMPDRIIGAGADSALPALT
jgi:exopolysaccharide production protein ExoQ